MWDSFWKVVIFVALVAALSTCMSCSMGKEKPADLVEDMADNCKYGMKRGSVKQDDDDKEVIVECASGVGI